MFNAQKYAATVVLFNPCDRVLDNILTYYNGVEILFIIDNSEEPNNNLILELKKLKKIFYYSFNCNKGIALALNFAASLAIKDGFEFLFTFDQDSNFDNGFFENYIASINFLDLEKIGIITPFHDMNKFNSNSNLPETTNLLTVATSGNLLNLKIFSELGGFLEKLFIDYVDNEYCLRINKNGYKIVRLNKILMNHSLGELSVKRILGNKISITNHSPIRLYYRIRNRLYVISKHYLYFPKYSFLIFRLIFSDIFKVVFFEKNKRLKLKMMFFGVMHFFQSKYGKYNGV